ncbi:ATP-binding protein [Streptomyces xantholiticus]|uniref:ATP-binding protein n=1 Tax=Streptomyces xantholiticus TaxID=68285 RepID=UPI001679368C|nr:hypothetical protein GCM10010381_35490 [Streptomyces xantholiticus]
MTVSVREKDGRIVPAVADDGPGVPEQERERIFERFIRLGDAHTRDAHGRPFGVRRGALRAALPDATGGG